jgi:hypothetical protein
MKQIIGDELIQGHQAPVGLSHFQDADAAVIKVHRSPVNYTVDGGVYFSHLGDEIEIIGNESIQSARFVSANGNEFRLSVVYFKGDFQKVKWDFPPQLVQHQKSWKQTIKKWLLA